MKKNLLRGVFAAIAFCFATVASAATVITPDQFESHVGQEVTVQNLAPSFEAETFAADQEYWFFSKTAFTSVVGKPAAALVGKPAPTVEDQVHLTGIVKEGGDMGWYIEISSIAYAPTAEGQTLAAPQEAFVGDSVKIVFSLSGKNLTGDLTLSGESSDDADAVFAFESTTITKTQAETPEFESYVTLVPKTVSSVAAWGATPNTYTINIKAGEDAIGTIEFFLTVNDTVPAISFPEKENPTGDIYVGDTVEATIFVKGNKFVTDTVFLQIPEGSSIISLSPDTLLPSQVTTGDFGAEVKALISPKAAGYSQTYEFDAVTSGIKSTCEELYIYEVLAAEPAVEFDFNGGLNAYVGHQCSKSGKLIGNKFLEDSVFLTPKHADFDSIVPAAFSAAEAKAGALFTVYLTPKSLTGAYENFTIEATSKGMESEEYSFRTKVQDSVPEITPNFGYIYQEAKVGIPFVHEITISGNPFITKDVTFDSESSEVKAFVPSKIAAAELAGKTVKVQVVFLPTTKSDSIGNYLEDRSFPISICSEEHDTIPYEFAFGVRDAQPLPGLVIEPTGANVDTLGLVHTTISRPTTVNLHVAGSNLYSEWTTLYITADNADAKDIPLDTIQLKSSDINEAAGVDTSFTFIPATDGTYTIKVVAQSLEFPIEPQEVSGVITSTPYFSTTFAVNVKPNPDVQLEATGYNVDKGTVYTYGAGPIDIALHATGAHLEGDVELILAVAKGGAGKSTIDPDTILLKAADLEAEGGHDFSIRFNADTIGFYELSVKSEAIGLETAIFVHVKAIPDLIIEPTGYNAENGFVSIYGANPTDITLRATSTNAEDDIELVLSATGYGKATLDVDTILLSADSITAEGGYEFTVRFTPDTIGSYTIALASEAIDFTNSIAVQVKAIPELIIEPTGHNVEAGFVSTYGAGKTEIQLHATGANLEEDVEIVLSASGPGAATLSADTIVLKADSVQAEGGYDFTIALTTDTIGAYQIAWEAAAIDLSNTIYVQVKAIPELIIEPNGYNAENGYVSTYGAGKTEIQLHATGANLEEDVEIVLSASGPGTATLSADTIILKADSVQAEGGYDFTIALTTDTIGAYQIAWEAAAIDLSNTIYVQVKAIPELIIEPNGYNDADGYVTITGANPTDIQLHAAGANLEEDVELVLAVSGGLGKATIDADTIILKADELQSKEGHDFSILFTPDTIGFYTIALTAEAIDFSHSIYVHVKAVPELIVEATGDNVELGIVYTTEGEATNIQLHATGANLSENVLLHASADGYGDATLSTDSIVLAVDSLGKVDSEITLGFTATAAGMYTINLIGESADFPIVTEEYEGVDTTTPTLVLQITVYVEELADGLYYLNADTNKTIKVLENGQVYIIRNGMKYSVSGSKVQ